MYIAESGLEGQCQGRAFQDDCACHSCIHSSLEAVGRESQSEACAAYVTSRGSASADESDLESSRRCGPEAESGAQGVGVSVFAPGRSDGLSPRSGELDKERPAGPVDLVTWGKHAGHSMEELMADTSYVKWLFKNRSKLSHNEALLVLAHLDEVFMMKGKPRMLLKRDYLETQVEEV